MPSAKLDFTPHAERRAWERVSPELLKSHGGVGGFFALAYMKGHRSNEVVDNRRRRYYQDKENEYKNKYGVKESQMRLYEGYVICLDVAPTTPIVKTVYQNKYIVKFKDEPYTGPGIAAVVNRQQINSNPKNIKRSKNREVMNTEEFIMMLNKKSARVAR